MTSAAAIRCPACHSRMLREFYSLSNVPVHDVRLMPSVEAARRVPRGEMRAAFCKQCGLIHNAAFDPESQRFAIDYEGTQSYSATFSAFQQQLADTLIDRFDLRGKTIIEIGCGKGEFLALLCRRGDNRGVGFDPAFDPARDPSAGDERVRYIQDLYSARYADIAADFACCLMTLEHIGDPATLLRPLGQALAGRSETTILFQVPEVTRILREFAFWDVYYEHAAYYSCGSLARLFRAQGFEVRDLWTEFDEQYLMLAARPAPRSGRADADGSAAAPLPGEEDLAALRALVDRFTSELPARRSGWTDWISELHSSGQRVVLWGGGSKAVAFVTTLDAAGEIDCAVDINPHKQGHYLPGSGLPVVAPEALVDRPPALVVLMNPIYRREVRAQLDELAIGAPIVEVTVDPRRREGGV